MALNHEIKICQKISWHCHLNRIRTATWSRRPKCVFATKFAPGPSLWRKERFGGGRGGEDVCVRSYLRRLHRRLSRNSRAISWRNVWNNYSKELSIENFQRILKTSFFLFIITQLHHWTGTGDVNKSQKIQDWYIHLWALHSFPSSLSRRQSRNRSSKSDSSEMRSVIAFMRASCGV